MAEGGTANPAPSSSGSSGSGGSGVKALVRRGKAIPAKWWLITVAAAIAVGLIIRNMKSSGQTKKKSETDQEKGILVYPNVGRGPGDDSRAGMAGPPGPSDSGTNAGWFEYVLKGLTAAGYNPSEVSQSLIKYLNGKRLNGEEWVIVRTALTRYGPPPKRPVPEDNPMPLPTPVPSETGPQPTNPVNGGTSLTKQDMRNLAKEKYGNGNLWPRIYNANLFDVQGPDDYPDGNQFNVPGIRQSGS